MISRPPAQGLAKRICPQATLSAHTNTKDVRDGVDWRDDAMRKSVHPILDIYDIIKNRKK